MKPQLQLAAVQKLSFTPQLKQSLEILQLSDIELQSAIDEALTENPLLEQISRASESQTIPTEQHKGVERLDFQHRPSASTNNQLEQQIESPVSLREHLIDQVRLTSLSHRDRLIATAIIDCLDHEGYCTLSVEEVSALLPAYWIVEQDEVQAVLSLVKTLDPLGVGAANLGERMLIQLSQCESGATTQLAKKIAAHHLDLLAKHDYRGLEKNLSITSSQLKAAIELIAGLNPRLSGRFTQIEKLQIVPDILVRGNAPYWYAELNRNNLRKLAINENYLSVLRAAKDQQSREFLSLHAPLAKQFIEALRSRYSTLLEVAEAITRYQQAFFSHGAQAMKPLGLATIADQLGLHESTVSRAINGKYLQCKQGVFELKYFFSHSANDAGDSATSVQALIQQLIANESGSKPLSDNRLAHQLAEHGHRVARRTVAKYRDRLNIPPASQRKTLQPQN